LGDHQMKFISGFTGLNMFKCDHIKPIFNCFDCLCCHIPASDTFRCK